MNRTPTDERNEEREEREEKRAPGQEEPPVREKPQEEKQA